VLTFSRGVQPVSSAVPLTPTRPGIAARQLALAAAAAGVLVLPFFAVQAVPAGNPASLAAIAAIPLTQAILVSALMVQRRRRKSAEDMLRHRETALQITSQRMRELGQRVLLAQEAERARIARELHDDISQQLTLLHIDMRLAECDSETLDRVERIGRSVHELSWRMHPAKLQTLGLVNALRSLQQEHSRALSVVLSHGDIPKALSPDATLCVFRVVQEALQNAVKYSHATGVLVDLQCDGTWIALTVVDDGVGFDMDRTWSKGLGLISMRERVEASEGTLVVCSQPGHGTRIDVRVPLRLRPAAEAPATHQWSSAGIRPDAASAPLASQLKPLHLM
jgi:signal transduction histidine kinase